MKSALILFSAFICIKATAQTSNVVIAKTSPNTKYIDASRFYPFINGKAIVEKGQACGVIDTAGNFIIPYNKYQSIHYAGKNLLNASDGNHEIVLNNKGAVVADFGTLYKKGYYTTTEGDFILIRPNAAKNFTLIDGAGKSYAITVGKLPDGRNLEYSSISEDAIIFTAESGNGANKVYGFKNLNNQLVGEAVFKTLFPFKNGFAVYGLMDSYGVQKFGIIDITGKKITAPIFSTDPVNLGHGYFRAEATADADFYYAILNSRGDILFKETKAKPLTYNFVYYEDGYFFGNHFVMDVSGHIMTEKDFVAKLGYTSSKNQFAFFVPCKNEDFLTFNSTDISSSDGVLVFKYLQNGRNLKLGLMNVKTNKIIFAPFSDETQLGYDYIFDPVAHMAMVYQEPGNGAPAVTGYMTADGIIRIVQAEKKSGF